MRYTYHSEVIGVGPPVIFLPAAGFTGMEGLNIAEHLENDFEVHMLNLPCYERGNDISEHWTSAKMACWLGEYLNRENLKKVNLIGHSIGGGLALAFAVHYPERVNKLVLLDQGHKPMPRIPKADLGKIAYIVPMLNMFHKLIGKSFAKKVETLFTKVTNQRETDFETKVQQFCAQVAIKESEYVRKALKDLQAVPIHFMFGYYNLDLPKLLKKVDAPTYLVYGTYENILEKESYKVKKNIQRLKEEDLPIQYRPVKSGHYVHWSDPSILDDVEHFLNDQQPAFSFV